MPKRSLFIFIYLFITTIYASAQTFSIAGSVLNKRDGKPVTGGVVSLGTDYLWTTSDSDGAFMLSNIQKGEYILEVSCLGYVSHQTKLVLDKNKIDIIIQLEESSLALEEVVVTAQKAKDGLGTTHNLGRDALNHLQITNTSDISSLLPGGKTVNPDLTSKHVFSLREGGSNTGNASFGTAVEVDGVRIDNNASFGEPGGADTRNVAVENIESIEVITGVPSAEYGDLNSGMVKIKTRKGRTPVNVTFSVNPRTYQVSASKGIDLHKDNGVLNVSAEWARATKKLVSPYSAYSRSGFSASYSNTFAKVLRFEAGLTGNLGGMNTKDDPDAFTGEFKKERDNSFRGNASATWLLNRKWITNLKLDASVNFNDNLVHYHKYESYASNQPAVHSELAGYFVAERLPLTYFSDQITDSKQLDLAASLKYNWHKRWGDWKSSLKAGIQWKANGNVGQGEYYEDPALAANGYRPRPYADYPFMHNLSVYAEEHLTIPIAKTKLEVTAGLRLENVFIKNSLYSKKTTLSPRFNAKWQLAPGVSIRGGWGVTEKLPSYYILYPKPEYRDIQTFGISLGDKSSYVYYTHPYSIAYNPDLKWQSNSNSEFGIDLEFNEMSISLVGFYNVTRNPYRMESLYEPFTYNISRKPDAFEIPEGAQVRVDSNTGIVQVGSGSSWTDMDVLVTDRTFVKTQRQTNGADVRRGGVELVMEFPEIKAIKTKFRLDASYVATDHLNDLLSYYYQNGWSHTSLPNRSYQYVGIYANGGNTTSVANGKRTHNLDANLTMITHIPQARIVITCRLEATFLRMSRNLSEYAGKAYAYTVSEGSTIPTGGDIYDGNSYTAVRPVAYMDLDGNVKPFTDAEAADPEFASLIMRSSNVYTFAQDGYGPYLSANLSVTKEIGKKVSLSFYANNFTNSRMAVKSFATGVSSIFTPSFYYGLTCRLKF
ncbi:MAG: TonB-dependent receptor [Bacteroidales bacterium]|nr:TonB-dependent receptor [Bacteroidales bacterium]